MIDKEFLKALTEVPAAGIAAAPGSACSRSVSGMGILKTFVPDFFCLFRRQRQLFILKVIFVAHMDEVGGCIYGAASPSAKRKLTTPVSGQHAGHFRQCALCRRSIIWPKTDDTFPVRAKS